MTDIPPWSEQTPLQRESSLRQRHLRRRRIAARATQIVVVVVMVVIGLRTVGTGQIDNAAVFVGLPVLLAVAITVSPPARSAQGTTFKVVTLGLLVVAVLVREGVICLFIAAPLVYGVAHGVVALVARGGRRTYALVPLAVALSLEGFAPGLRIVPNQSVTATHTVALSAVAVEQHIAAGPDFSRVRRPWLLAMIPLPGHVTGSGLDVGDGWDFVFHGDNHGPGGDLVCLVTARTSTATGGSVDFTMVSDDSVVHRWLFWTSGTLRWQDSGGRTTVTLTLSFTRRLDPSWYFGPIEQTMVSSGADVVLDALGLADAS